MKTALYTTFHTLLEQLGAEATARHAKRLGFDGVELYADAIKNVSAIQNVTEAKTVKAALDAEGLSMVCASIAYDAVACPDAERVMRPYAEIAHALGTPFLHHTLLIHPVKTDGAEEIRRKLSLAADAAVRIARMADAYGLTCIYEDQGMYVNGMERFSLFFEEVKSRAKNVGVCADLGNILYVDEMPESFLSHFAKEVKHLHIKDLAYRKFPIPGAKSERRSLGGMYLYDTPFAEGDINIPACIDILVKAGYTGACSLELPPHLSTNDGLSAAIKYIKI